MDKVVEYRRFLDEYDAVISQNDWWDGRRDALVRAMDALWAKMSPYHREACEEYAWHLYKKRGGG